MVDLPAPPLHQSAPRIPAVLSGIIGKLLEKDPARRYQSADDLHTELLNLQNTLGQGKSTISYPITAITRIRSHTARRLAAAVAAVAALILVALAVLRFWPSPVALQGPPPSTGAVASTRRILRVDQAGTADYRTINEALAAAGPNATIRVLGTGTYHEAIAITGSPCRGLVLEAPNHAILESAEGNRPVVRVQNAPDVTIRGFEIKTAADQNGLFVTGGVSGLVIEDVRLTQTPEMLWAALLFDGAVNGPVTVRGCTFRCGQFGLAVGGKPASQIRIENNRFLAAITHLYLMGTEKAVSVTGNIFVKGIGVGVNLPADADSRGIRISNNTFLDCSSWMTFEGADLPPESVVSNNLMLGANNINPVNHSVDDLLKHWAFRNNWWEPSTETDAATAAQFAEIHQQIEVLSRDPNNPAFLRPKPDSPLGTAGAGNGEPNYVGALPPAGAK